MRGDETVSKVHLMKMTKGVDDLYKELKKQPWARSAGDDPSNVKSGDVVFLLGHGGGRECTVQAIEYWEGHFKPKCKDRGGVAFVLLMCGSAEGTGNDANSQIAELLVIDGAALAVYAHKIILLVYVMDMPADLGLRRFDEIFDRHHKQTWPFAGNTTNKWECLREAT